MVVTWNKLGERSGETRQRQNEVAYGNEVNS